MPLIRSLLVLALCLAPGLARAVVIRVGPADGYAPIERAQAGDEVVLAPGTYRFRVFLTQRATAERPIVIRAEDPARPPVWDPGPALVESLPGSYTAGDRGRGCWQFSGAAHYRVSGVVFTHCRNAARNAAGVRYYAGTLGLVVSDCVFRENDNGVVGGTQGSEATVEFSEFDRNGNRSASSPTHNLYVYGGTFALRYSYLHDPVQAQNFHVRARDAVLEYNWIARAASYEGDLMTDDDGAGRQSMLLRGNVIVQSPAAQNRGQIVALYNDAGARGVELSARLVNNTIVAANARAAVVHLSNADGTVMRAELVNNVLAGTELPVRVEDAARGTFTGTHNWLRAGVAPMGLANTVSSAAPGFVNPAAGDYRLAAGSAGRGAAAAAADAPAREYYRDETVTRRYRVRTTARDLGAFETTTTGVGIGPSGVSDGGVSVDASVRDAVVDVVSDVAETRPDAGVVDAGASDVPTTTGGEASTGCGCAVPRRNVDFHALALGLVFALKRRRSGRS